MMASHTIKSIKLGSWKVSINTKYLCLPPPPPSDKHSLQQLLVSFIYRPKQNINIWFVILLAAGAKQLQS